MVKEKKPREQYNWKFKGTESEEFHEWFNNQDNIGNSLRSLVYHMIDLYGTTDILDPIIQKKIITDSIILQHFEGRDVLSINSKDIETTNSNSTEVLNNKVNTVQSDSKEYKESPDKINPEKPKYNKNAVDINNI